MVNGAMTCPCWKRKPSGSTSSRGGAAVNVCFFWTSSGIDAGEDNAIVHKGGASGACGMSAHRMTYTMMPGNAAERIEARTYSTRTSVGSHPSHSAIPPQTPAIIEYLLERT